MICGGTVGSAPVGLVACGTWLEVVVVAGRSLTGGSTLAPAERA